MRTLIGALAVLGLTACGPTVGQVVDKYKPEIDAKMERFTAIMESLTPDKEAQPVAGLTRPFFFTAIDHDPDSNIAFFPAHELMENETELDFYIQGPLYYAQGWAKGDSLNRSEQANKELAETFEKAIKTPYVGLYRQVSYVRPYWKDDGTFAQGGIRVEAVILELEARTMVAHCDATAVSAKDLMISSYNDKPTQEELETAAKSQLKELVLVKLAECFAQQTGGQFKFSA